MNIPFYRRTNFTVYNALNKKETVTTGTENEKSLETGWHGISNLRSTNVSVGVIIKWRHGRGRAVSQISSVGIRRMKDGDGRMEKCL